jgi:hypothetical protein
MISKRLLSAILVVGLLPIGSCSSPAQPAKPRRQGAKVNVSNFAKQTTTYKGKTVTLSLKIDESINKNQSQSLRELVGKDAHFTTATPDGERLNLIISIPQDLSVPDATAGDDLVVTFVCQRGDLRQGNVAKLIQASDGPWEDVD